MLQLARPELSSERASPILKADPEPIPMAASPKPLKEGLEANPQMSSKKLEEDFLPSFSPQSIETMEMIYGGPSSQLDVVDDAVSDADFSAVRRYLYENEDDFIVKKSRIHDAWNDNLGGYVFKDRETGAEMLFDIAEDPNLSANFVRLSPLLYMLPKKTWDKFLEFSMVLQGRTVNIKLNEDFREASAYAYLQGSLLLVKKDKIVGYKDGDEFYVAAKPNGDEAKFKVVRTIDDYFVLELPVRQVQETVVANSFRKKIDANFPPETAAADMVEFFQIREGGTYSGVHFNLGTIDLKEIDYYLALQEAIARIVPNEMHRPGIELKLRASALAAEELTPTNTIAVLGGAGPLSDAHFLHALAKKDMKVHLHLMSVPPPRLNAIASSEFFQAGARYFQESSKLMRQGYRRHILVSNTAHLQIGVLHKMAGKDNVLNLVEDIAESVQRRLAEKGTAEAPVGIWGTTAAYRKLYPEYFGKMNPPVISGVPNRALQDQIQIYIDKVKSGVATEADHNLFMQTIIDVSERNGVKNIILSCTEIPFGLGSERMRQIAARGIEIFDTEKMMVDIVARQKPLQ